MAAHNDLNHLWQGEWISDEELKKRIRTLPTTTSVEPDLFLSRFLDACVLYGQKLLHKEAPYHDLAACLKEQGQPEKDMAELADFLRRESLEVKLKREFGATQPFLQKRFQFRQPIFETWAPLGLLVHVAPSNAASVGPLTVIEGLLAGNINFLKTSGGDNHFSQIFFEGLFDCDPTESIKERVVIAKFSSREKDMLKIILSQADGIVAWGGEEAIKSIKVMAPSSARFIDWGHKISFVYVTKEYMDDETTLKGLAREICLMEQQACSSPQCVYIDSDSPQDLKAFSQNLAKPLAEVSRATPQALLSPEEAAEISLVTELAREESLLGLGEVIEGPGSWRILIDHRSALRASPLFRTVWVKPLPRDQIAAALKPMAPYLQTVGLAASLSDLATLATRFTQAGAVRVRAVGDMLGSYNGEPHDGVYALQRYARRVSYHFDERAQGMYSFYDLQQQPAPVWRSKPPIMTKAEFQVQAACTLPGEVFFKSGGSTGEPKLSAFTWDDYDAQMWAGAEGLLAAGFDPSNDRSINLFFVGHMYGGFLSIYSVLERLRAVQFPMAAIQDYKMIVDTIIKNKINVIMGMPSYVMQLFEKEEERLSSYRQIKKVFYGGEHFTQSQSQRLNETFGVSIVRSIGYGSVDTGPLGYQCEACDQSIHHVHQRLQYLEIIKADTDEPVTGTDVGRLIFTSRARRAQNLDRYEIGDVGHWVFGDCACGRKSPRFRLLGRLGDVFRIGSIFLNYQRVSQIVSDAFGYTGPIQLALEAGDRLEVVRVMLAEDALGRAAISTARVRDALLETYDDLRGVVIDEEMLELEVCSVPNTSLKRSQGSGKVLRVVDQRE